MKKIFTEPTKPEELYEFFTYGLSLTPLDWRLRWQPNAIQNTIRRRLWYANIVWHSASVLIDYQPGVKVDSAWHIYKEKYVYK